MRIDSIHVSVDGLRLSEDISYLLDKYQIKTYKDLEEAIDKYDEVRKNYFLRVALNDFKNMFKYQKNADEVYQNMIKNQSESSKMGLRHYDVDKLVKAYDLPFFKLHPNLLYGFVYDFDMHGARGVTTESFGQYSIAYVKDKMNDFIIRDGVSIPKVLKRPNGIGELRYNELVASLRFYDSYIEDLLKNYSDKENPFYYMREEKLELVRQSKKYIFDYLNEEGYELIIGSLSSVMHAVNVSNTGSPAEKKLAILESIIADYVTFDEALEIESPKVLNKFIVPYGKR